MILSLRSSTSPPGDNSDEKVGGWIKYTDIGDNTESLIGNYCDYFLSTIGNLHCCGEPTSPG